MAPTLNSPFKYKTGTFPLTEKFIFWMFGVWILTIINMLTFWYNTFASGCYCLSFRFLLKSKFATKLIIRYSDAHCISIFECIYWIKCHRCLRDAEDDGDGRDHLPLGHHVTPDGLTGTVDQPNTAVHDCHDGGLLRCCHVGQSLAHGRGQVRLVGVNNESGHERPHDGQKEGPEEDENDIVAAVGYEAENQDCQNLKWKESSDLNNGLCNIEFIWITDSLVSIIPVFRLL